jgi:hypothetical protein
VLTYTAGWKLPPACASSWGSRRGRRGSCAAAAARLALFQELLVGGRQLSEPLLRQLGACAGGIQLLAQP